MQGEFDNLHIAPRMVAPLPVLKAYPAEPSFKRIAMAPFCVHDCLHTHWRWGSANTDKQSLGWQGMQPFARAGAPLVPFNQKIIVELAAPNSFRYRAEVHAPIQGGQWQVIFHHGSAYALTINKLGKLAKLGQFGLLTLGGEAPIERSGSNWAMFYWHLRYRHDLAGFQERIKVTNLAKARG